MWSNFLGEFYVHWSGHRESNLITVKQDATYSVYYISLHVELPTEMQ